MVRFLVGWAGLDGHDRGAKTIAAVLRDHGMEVIYTGLHQTPEMIAEAAMQEDVDVVGLSILSGAHLVLVPKVLEALRARGVEGVLVVVGGIVPPEDVEPLRGMGVAGVFGPGTPMASIVEFVRQHARPRGG